MLVTEEKLSAIRAIRSVSNGFYCILKNVKSIFSS